VKLANFSVGRPVTTAMIFIGAIVLGLAAMFSLGIDLMPELEIPAVSVITSYQGAGAEEVETLITKPLEETLSTISGVDDVISTSKEGLSAVTLKFKWGEKITEKVNDVRDKVDLAKGRLPDEAEAPVIFKFDLSMQPIMIIAVTAEDSYPQLQKIVDDAVVDPLKQVKGVAAAIPLGGLTRQIRVDLDRARMAALAISVDQVNAALVSQNISVPGGSLKMGTMDYLIRTPEEFSSAEQVSRVVIMNRGGSPVMLKDIAEVRDFYKEKDFDVRANKKRAMGIMIQKQSGENTVDVARGVKAELEQIRKRLPPDVKVKAVMDSSDFIIASVNTLTETVFFAIFFVFLVILFFLRDLRASLIVCTSVPVSLIITFVLMKLAGYTINTNTLASLAIAVGLVVDDAIVVVDNIRRHRDRGQGPVEGAIYGTNEVGVAVVASTLTTVCIFAPIVFVGGIAKVVFGEFAAVISMSLMASLYTAMMLVPMLSARFLKVRDEDRKRMRIVEVFYDSGERTLSWLERQYHRLLKWVLGNRKTVLALCAILIVWAGGMVFFVGMEFFPQQDQRMIMANCELPIGTRFEQTGQVEMKMQELAMAHVPEMEDSFIFWGVDSDDTDISATQYETYKGQMFMALSPKKARKATPTEIIERMRPMTDRIPGAKIRYSAADPLMEMMFGGGKQIAIEVYGHDLKIASDYAKRIEEAISKVPGVKDIEISRQQAKPELKIVVDREKASSLGLSVRAVGKTIETLFSGTTATKFRQGGDEYDVRVRLRDEDRTRIEDLRDVYVMTSDGRPVSLANIARIEQGLGPTQIERKDQSRYITISASFVASEGRKLSNAVNDIRRALEKMPATEGFRWTFGGAEQERETAFKLLLGAALLGMILVYMVMASQFESTRDPFIIFLSIPFGLVGVVFGLVITGQTLSVISFIATIMLTGIVVKNGIVLISFIGILRKRGVGIYEAILQGGRSRLRPILSTTLTTILGFFPLLLSRGEGSEIWQPFAATIIGGLIVGTVVTLVLMPALYSIFEGAKPLTSEEAAKL
jgi:hydrophobe/amphiphile efflux-1 (HAE1) family protein